MINEEKIISQLLFDDSDLTRRLRFKIVIDAGFKLLFDHAKENKITNPIDLDANSLFQMSLMKSLSIVKLLEGLNYVDDRNGDNLTNIMDPFTIGGIVRSQFEAYCLFNHVFIQSKTKEEIEYKYYLWVIAGLKERQNFERSLSKSSYKGQDSVEYTKIRAANKIKAANEAQSILKYQKIIFNNRLIQNLSPDEAEKIQSALKKKNYQIKIESGKVIEVRWHEMFLNSGTDEKMEETYRYLCQYSHPSNISAFQFKDLYQKGKNHSIEMSYFVIKYSEIIMSFFTRDYCQYFLDLNKKWNTLPNIPRNVLFQNNNALRGKEFAFII